MGWSGWSVAVVTVLVQTRMHQKLYAVTLRRAAADCCKPSKVLLCRSLFCLGVVRSLNMSLGWQKCRLRMVEELFVKIHSEYFCKSVRICATLYIFYKDLKCFTGEKIHFCTVWSNLLLSSKQLVNIKL